MKVDFKKLKTDISLPDLLIHYGWNFAPGTSNAAVKMTNGSQTIVIKKNSLGQYTYWDVHGESRGKSCLDFMQEHLYEQTGKMPNIREVGEVLQSFLDDRNIITTENSNIKVTNANLTPAQITELYHELKPYNGDFLSKRGITNETISSSVFSDVFYTRQYKYQHKEYNNTCIKLINATGMQGISQRGFNEDGQSFKGIKGHKYGSIAVSRHDKSRPLDLVFVGESMIDNASHYQIKLLNSDKNILYISTEGNITQGQIELIHQLLLHQKINDITNQVKYIFDNDHNGYKYALKLDGFLKEQKIPEIEQLSTDELKILVNQLPNKELPILIDWNEDLQTSIQATNEKNFFEAINNKEYSRLINLQEKGFKPSAEAIKLIEQTTPYEAMIAVKKIFAVYGDTKTQLKNDKTNDVNSKSCDKNIEWSI